MSGDDEASSVRTMSEGGTDEERTKGREGKEGTRKEGMLIVGTASPSFDG